ncbi:MAG TPA: TonB family protein [Thermoanaerobaculia bacterium]
MTDPQTRQSRGLLVVIALAVVFFALLVLIVLKSSRDEPRPMAESETLTVIPMRISIRTEPQARAPVVTSATRGDRLTMLEDRDAWVRVRNSEGLEGWAERANLERVVEQQRREKRAQTIRNLPPLEGVATSRTPLYAGPGIFYPLVGELAKGADVTVHTRDHEFYAIAYGKAVAYAEVSSIDIAAPLAHELIVRTNDDASIEETDTAPREIAEFREDPPAPVESAPEPVAEAPRVQPVGGVYSVVPPGGTQPEELDRVVPNYPPAARRAGIQGPVVVRGIVRRDGRIDNVEVIRDLPYGLGNEARRAVSRWRFRPATYRGEPIDVYYTVTVNFRLQ